MRRDIIPYNPHLKERARELRNNATHSETLLWKHLKGKQMLGYDFHRQKPLDDFIVDFYCSEMRLAIEVDGCSHNDKAGVDEVRQKRLESVGIRILRFADADVRNNIEGVVLGIENWVRKHTPPFGHPSQEGTHECVFCTARVTGINRN